MAKKTKTTSRKKKKQAKRPLVKRIRRWVFGLVCGALAVVLIWIAAYAVFNPPTTQYIQSEKRRLGSVKWEWVEFEDIAPSVATSIVAAEDANYCLHWGFDMAALREAIEDGGNRGASTLSQQVVKNVFLWHGRSYVRKALEALMTPVVEAVWSKRRILEVYMNIAEFDEGVFGIAAASQHYFGVRPDQLTNRQAALLAAILPNPKGRSASNPGAFTRNRATSIADGSATIQQDGRADCFAD